jgi:NADP-dependent 3-hydroxy acid dehydrogenase YdfG
MTDQYDRIAIVTGVTSGIGKAVTKKLAATGSGVVGNARSAERLGDLEKELGGAFCGVAGDASDSTVLEKLFAAAGERFARPVDIVVANAGRGLGGSVKDADLSQFDDMLKINVTGTLCLLQKAARKMIEGRQQAYPAMARDIVIVGSVVGRHVSPFSAVYSATKFAVHGLAEALRREMGPHGVRVSLVEPGLVSTGFQAAAGYSGEMMQNFEKKFGPLLTGDDIARAIHYIVTQPPHVHVSDIIVRPTRQDYP